ncbi:hypothetical protein D9758_007671 [Tetrapyrgos nigripes]|uniref:T6SS Phospholipase effector Tle1-like catalytic domain-containing protein n=1 Tax=Tetrapyrgos nigripes TaxID=182062 RepID=A0A8H5G5A8_9AGAR|nr:hypothetical protein D9758_007671 [Tetrapyrgos nigripes]
MTQNESSNHNQEITMTSLTDTVVEHGPQSSPQRLPIPSFSSYVEIPEHDQAPEATGDEENDILSSPNGLLTLPLQTTSPAASSRTRPLPLRKDRNFDSRAIPETIPPVHENRTLVLCFDGTGDQFDADNSNVVQLFSLLKKDDSSKQMVYYQSGIGTYCSPQIPSPLMSKLDQTLDAMIAHTLDAHVMDGYEFLMQNYTVNDRICIFGFSRGAYTARSLAGMLHKQVPFAYKMYTRTDQVGWAQSDLFKRTFSRDVQIEFIGVWDTVDSVGIIPKRLPFTTSNTIVRTFRHALSLDERRAKFKANLWNRSTPVEQNLGTTPKHKQEMWFPDEPSESNHTQRDQGTGKEGEKGRQSHSRSRQSHEKDPSRPSFEWVDSDDQIQSSFEGQYSARDLLDRPTDVEEVWFAGCHCDVGGGSVKNFTRHSLARISLRWMVRECFKTRTGIMFDSSRLRLIGLDAATLYPVVTPRPDPLPAGNMKIRCHTSGDPQEAPGISTRVWSSFKDSIPLPGRKSKKPASLESKKKDQEKSFVDDEDRPPMMILPDTWSKVHSATAKFMGRMESVRNKLRKSTLDSDELTVEVKSPPPPDPMEVIDRGAPHGSLTEEEEELHDAMSPKYDQLKLTPGWWILEYIPMQSRFQRGDAAWVTTFGMNRARPRHIPRQTSDGVKIHRSVKMRMEAMHHKLKDGKPTKYAPKAPVNHDKITWVD